MLRWGLRRCTILERRDSPQVHWKPVRTGSIHGYAVFRLLAFLYGSDSRRLIHDFQFTQDTAGFLNLWSCASRLTFSTRTEQVFVACEQASLKLRLLSKWLKRATETLVTSLSELILSEMLLLATYTRPFTSDSIWPYRSCLIISLSSILMTWPAILRYGEHLNCAFNRSAFTEGFHNNLSWLHIMTQWYLLKQVWYQISFSRWTTNTCIAVTGFMETSGSMILQTLKTLS